MHVKTQPGISIQQLLEDLKKMPNASPANVNLKVKQIEKLLNSLQLSSHHYQMMSAEKIQKEQDKRDKALDGITKLLLSDINTHVSIGMATILFTNHTTGIETTLGTIKRRVQEYQKKIHDYLYAKEGTFSTHELKTFILVLKSFMKDIKQEKYKIALACDNAIDSTTKSADIFEGRLDHYISNTCKLVAAFFAQVYRLKLCPNPSLVDLVNTHLTTEDFSWRYDTLSNQSTRCKQIDVFLKANNLYIALEQKQTVDPIDEIFDEKELEIIYRFTDQIMNEEYSMLYRPGIFSGMVYVYLLKLSKKFYDDKQVFLHQAVAYNASDDVQKFIKSLEPNQ